MTETQTITCQYEGPHTGRCTTPATYLLDGAPYCPLHANGILRVSTIERIAPPAPVPAPTGPPAPMTGVDRAMHALTGLDSPSRRRGECHFCGQPLGRGGECEECR